MGPSFSVRSPSGKRRRSTRAAAALRSEALEQPLEIIELRLRTLRIGEAPAQLFKDAAGALYVDFARHLHRRIVAVVAAAQRPSERIGVLLRAHPAAAAGRSLTRTGTALLLHGLGKALGTLAQRLERASLGIDGTVGISLAERPFGILHRFASAAERSSPVLTLLALLTLLPLLVLVLTQAMLAQLLQELVEPVAQRLLVLLQVAHTVLALLTLLSLLALAAHVLTLLEGPVAQPLLLADHVAQFIELLRHVVGIHVVRTRHLQVLEHLLQLVEQTARGVLVPRAGEVLQSIDHALQVLGPQLAGVAVERTSELLRVLAHLLGQRLHEFVERGPQPIGQLFDLFVAGAAFERLAQSVLRGTQRLLGVGDVSVFDLGRHRPHAIDHSPQIVVGFGPREIPIDRAQAEIDARLGREALWRGGEPVERDQHAVARLRVKRENAPLLDQRSRQRLDEHPFGQAELERLALALVAGFVARNERRHHVGARPRVSCQI